MSNASLKKHFFLCAAPIIASSAIAVSPARAATFALSQAEFELTNFSHNPLSVSTSTDTSSLAIQGDPESTAVAAGEASATFCKSPAFLCDPPADEPFAFNESISQASGDGGSYLGIAKSSALVSGNFFVEAGEEFSFNFAAFLGLVTSIDKIPGEQAKAKGDISWQLFASSDPNEENWNLVDFFGISAQLVTPNLSFPDLDFAWFGGSENITFDLDPESVAFYGTAETDEIVQIAGQGSYSRSFDSNTYLKLVEIKTNQVQVKTPEPGSLLGLFAVMGFIGIGVARKPKTSKA